jgi:hypothetical protein
MKKTAPLAESFPAKFGPLGMKVYAQDAGQIEQGLYKILGENIVNLSNAKVTVKFVNPSKGLTIKVSPSVLGPGDVGKITYQINTKAAIHWGTTRYTADIDCNGKVVRPKVFGRVRDSNPLFLIDQRAGRKRTGNVCRV